MRSNRTVVFGLLMLSSAIGVPATNDSYAGQEQRALKALSEAEQADLLAGKGMGLAKAGELNGYPGPRHVLDLAEELQLSPDQRAATQSLFDRMQVRASALGNEIVAAERELDSLFATRRIDQQRLTEATERIGVLNGQLRAVHLSAHLEQTKILTSAQVEGYAQLRGYASADAGSQPDHGHHH
jgi:Spy/CpxP family protein refolding chaperone